MSRIEMILNQPPDQPEEEQSQRGSAMILVMVVLFMLMLLAVSVVGITNIRSQTSIESITQAQLRAFAESAIAVKIDQISLAAAAAGFNTSDATVTNNVPSGLFSGQNTNLKIEFPVTLEDGSTRVVATGEVWVDPAPLANDEVKLVVTVQSVKKMGIGGTSGKQLRTQIVAHLKSESHPAFSKAVYVGNKFGAGVNVDLGPTNEALATPSGSETTDPSNWDTTWNNDGDYVDGDVWVNGDINIWGTTTLWGNVDVTGSVNGGIVSGTITTGVSNIPPPDLASKDYRNNHDFLVNASNIGSYTGLFDKQREISATSDWYGQGTTTALYTKENLHLGRHSSGSPGFSSSIGLSSKHENKVIFVDANLWIHDANQKILTISGKFAGAVTIVVEGNLYIGDDLNYKSSKKDQQGVLIIAKGADDNAATSRREDESFHDGWVYNASTSAYEYDPTKRNYLYDPGERILNDEPVGHPLHGKYNRLSQGATGLTAAQESPKEGQGNIYYGDAAYGTGGVTDGFLYAQNNAYLTQPQHTLTNNLDKIYGVRGFLNAGGALDLGQRASGDQYRTYRVTYDDRIQTGALKFAGMPSGQGGGFKNLSVVAWYTSSKAYAATAN